MFIVKYLEIFVATTVIYVATFWIFGYFLQTFWHFRVQLFSAQSGQV